jgi:hypothetical protein
VRVHCSALSLAPALTLQAVDPTVTTGAPPKPLPPSDSVQLSLPTSLEAHDAEVSVGVAAAEYSKVHAAPVHAAPTPRTLSAISYVPSVVWAPVTHVTLVYVAVATRQPTPPTTTATSLGS